MKKSYYYGIHTAEVILKKYPEAILNIYLQETKNPRVINLFNLANKYGLTVVKSDKQKLDKLLGKDQARHQGVVLECREDLLFKSNSENDLKNFIIDAKRKNTYHNFFILILDEIQDPQNLGACIRSAEAMGVDCVILPDRNSADITSVVCKASAGAALMLPVYRVTNLARSIRWLKSEGIWVYGTDIDSKISLSKLGLNGSSAIIMGAEGTGIRKLTKDLCDELFTIPMFGKTQSLNVSVATGICLYEVTRQRS